MDKMKADLLFIREAERLKSILRTAHTTTGRQESTAEHSWRLALLAMILSGERQNLNAQRVLEMCLVHDLGEAFEGDIPAITQTDPAKKVRSERLGVERLTELLPQNVGEQIKAIWEEYEACQTPEARWVKALDKAETIIQHNQGANAPDFDYAFNLGYGAEWFTDDELLKELRSILDNQTRQHLRH